jgi:xylono-1,5-lactonase
MYARLVQREPVLITRSHRALLGEGPVWDERTQRLYWVDIERGEIHACDANGGSATVFSVGQRIGCIALRRERPGFIAGLERSIALITLEPLIITEVASFASLPAGIRCNDGKCDPDGRFWVGTYNMSAAEASGWLYRFEPEAEPRATAGPYICVNGPAISADGSTLYSVDSYGRTIERWHVGPRGELSGRSLFTRFEDPAWGYPDGLTFDLEGCLWVAHWGGHRVSRFSPAGELLDMIALPVAQPTSCSFGGDSLKRLFITSASVGLGPDQNLNGLAGSVFAVDLSVGGLPTTRFNG